VNHPLSLPVGVLLRCGLVALCGFGGGGGGRPGSFAVRGYLSHPAGARWSRLPGAAAGVKECGERVSGVATVILWVLSALSLGLAVWGLARRSAKAVFLAALPAGVFAFFFFWDPHGGLFFVWPLALLTAALSLRWPGRWREWLLLTAGISACGSGVLISLKQVGNGRTQPVPGEPAEVTPFDPDEAAWRVIAGYLQAVAGGDTHGLRGYVWRYAEASAGQPPVDKNEARNRLAAVESQGGFGAGGLWVEAYRAELVPDGAIFFTLVRESGDEAPKVASVSRELVNIHTGDAGPVDAAWCEDAEAAVRGYFRAFERRDLDGAVRWVHPEWRDFTAMPERGLRSLRLLSTKFYSVQRVGRVILLEYKVEAWARYPGLFTRQPYPRSTGRNTYFVMLAPFDPPVPAEWRIVCIGPGP